MTDEQTQDPPDDEVDERESALQSDPDFPPTWAEVRKLRREAGGWRTKLQAFKAQNTPQELERTRSEIRSLKVDLGLERAFAKHGAKRLTRAVLIDSGAMAALDPAEGDFDQICSDLVSEVLEREPTLRERGQIAATSGARFAGPGQPPSKQWSIEDVRNSDADSINQARAAGLLNQLLRRT